MSKEDNSKLDDTSQLAGSSFTGLIAKRRSMKVLTTVIVLGFISLIMALFIFGRRSTSDLAYQEGCGQGGSLVATEGMEGLFYGDSVYQDEFRSLIEAIESQPEYLLDGNCLGILSVYYARTGDPDKAEDLLHKLGEVSKEKDIEYLSAMDVKYVEELIDFHRQQKSAIEENLQINTFIHPEAQQ